MSDSNGASGQPRREKSFFLAFSGVLVLLLLTVLLILLLSTVFLVTDSYNPFLYFRF
ncbi:MAG: hypothetical protein J6U26_01540 [Lachnospiraceae bacterium]|nr:hypothetical protein [Lachnospiraceae bacterium]